ncbi:hypothetical protein V7x_28530 [Crateriforma conspicua]|uniref:DUF4222 domain-containing protein n=1 Tax=Crateriforma conspicua TaxID=2527996 RepID=A0A5C6FWL4_9PLAN|nr:hypothetical protein V7x_28530 [Crateriforma conspicua]
METIRRTRGVPAKRGGRVFDRNLGRFGTIMSARAGYLRIRLDGSRYPTCYHPTWRLDYLDDQGQVIKSTAE